MTVQIESDQPLPAGAEAWIEECARLNFSRFAHLIRRIQIQLRWLPSPAGKVSVYCLGMPAIVAETAAADPLDTISEVIGRAARMLVRRLRLTRLEANVAR